MTEALSTRLIRVLEALDEMGNAAIPGDTNIPAAGNPHYTISQRLGFMMLYGTSKQKEFATAADLVLTYIENHVFGIKTDSHCLDAVKGMPKDLPDAG